MVKIFWQKHLRSKNDIQTNEWFILILGKKSKVPEEVQLSDSDELASSSEEEKDSDFDSDNIEKEERKRKQKTKKVCIYFWDTFLNFLSIDLFFYLIKLTQDDGVIATQKKLPQKFFQNQFLGWCWGV